MMNNNKKLSVVIPCYNEQENIPAFFAKLLPWADANKFNVIAVNDGSSDETLMELQQFAKAFSCLEVISHKVNRGYGGAIKSGLYAVKTPFAITVDADGQHRLEDVIKCLDCIEKDNADMVVGVRQNDQSGGYRSLGKLVIRIFAASLLKLPVKDLNSGMKCYRMSETLAYVDLCPDTMAFSDCILLLLVNDNKKVTAAPILVEPRIAGKSTIGTQTALITLAEILNLAVLLRPLTTFCRLAVLFNIIGLTWGGFIYIKSQEVTSVTTMFVTLGVFSVMLGLLCEQLSQIRRRLAKIIHKEQ